MKMYRRLLAVPRYSSKRSYAVEAPKTVEDDGIPKEKVDRFVGRCRDFLRSVDPPLSLKKYSAIFSYAFDAEYFSHVVLDRNMQVIDFSNRKWTLMNPGDNECTVLDDDDRSLSEGLGAFRNVNLMLLRHMVKCTSSQACPLANDCIITEHFTWRVMEFQHGRDYVIPNIVRGILHEFMIRKREESIIRYGADPELLKEADVAYEIRNQALNRFFKQRIISKTSERLIIDKRDLINMLLKFCDFARINESSLDKIGYEDVSVDMVSQYSMTAYTTPDKTLKFGSLRLPARFLSLTYPEVFAQSLIMALLRAVAIAGASGWWINADKPETTQEGIL